VSERSGPTEIWARASDHTDRPVVTPADFPKERKVLPVRPALSPNGERLIFEALLGDQALHLWMMSLAGGSPIRLTNVEQGNEIGASWSPDGSRCVYIQASGSKRSLMTIRTSGNAAPIELKKDVSDYVPSWSPTGEWITYRDEKGWGLISPDGKATKFLGKIESPYLAFSRDGKLLYGLQIDENGGDPRRATLFSLDPATLKLKVIKEVGDELGMPSQKLEFGVAPDGKSIACSAVHSRPDLWMLTGYRQPGLWNQIKDAFHLSQTK
jgi:Tol biopolymer transport system component